MAWTNLKDLFVTRNEWDSVSQAPQIITGSDVWSCNANMSYIQMWTREQFIDRFGSDFDLNQDFIVAMNGDADAQPYAAVCGCYYDGGAIGCYVNGHQSGWIRLNFVYFKCR